MMFDVFLAVIVKNANHELTFSSMNAYARMYLQLLLQQWGAGNVYLLVLFS